MKKRFSITAFITILSLALTSSLGIVQAQGNTVLNGLRQGADTAFSSDTSSSVIDGSTTIHNSTTIRYSGRSTSWAHSGNATTTPSSYAALGDSVAAGLGLPITPGDSTQGGQCGRSGQGYPYLVARALHYRLTNVACSSAKAGDLITRQAVAGPNIPPQLSAAFTSGTPPLITITAGANDLHWADFVGKCYQATCGTSVDNAVASSYLAALKIKLYADFTAIQVRSHGQPPTTVITGYYNPFSAACSQLVPAFSPNEINWLNSQLNALNSTIQSQAARFSFVKFVPISFAGHDICSAQPWVQGLSAAAPFHPTAAGQQVIATAILQTLSH